MGTLITRMTTVLTALAGGAIIGSLFNGFGHYRHIYSGNTDTRSKELKLLEAENAGRLKNRIIIGCVLGAVIGTAAGVLISQFECCSDEDEG